MDKIDKKISKIVFFERLLKLKRHLKWTQKKLALESEISERTISRWVVEGIKPQNESIIKISEATGCNPQYLTGDEENMFLAKDSSLKVPKLKDSEDNYDLHGGDGIQFHPDEEKLLKKVVIILGSETDYSKTLEQNINIFHRALEAEETNRRKGERRKQDSEHDGKDRRVRERRQKTALGE